MNSENQNRKVCEACGEEFACGAALGACWCFGASVGAEKLEKLRGDFKDCLCEKCLSGDSGETDLKPERRDEKTV